MTTLSFLAEWALRSALVVGAAALILKALRVQDPSIKLAAWKAVLAGSLLIPALSPALPGLRVAALRTPSPAIIVPPANTARVAGVPGGEAWAPLPTAKPLNLPSVALAIYFAGGGVMLFRLFTGIVLTRRLVRRSRSTERSLPDGLRIHESADMAAPATLGILIPIVVLPQDWREWEASKLEAILAHEQSHVRRRDPAVQFLSVIHRSLLWFSPLSWFVHDRIVRLAEEASDDAALAAANDRVSYAEVLLDFMQRGGTPARWQGVAMARYGKADDRIDRILDGTRLYRGITRLGWIAILTLAAPMVYFAAAARPDTPQMPEVASAVDPESPSPPQKETDIITRYLIVSGDSSSGSYSSRDRLPLDEWRSKYGSEFAWFRRDGKDYLVTDVQVLDDLHRAMAPQREVNRLQAEVNRQQGEVNRLQEGVNRLQGEVNRKQGEINRQQSEVNDRQHEGITDHRGQSRVNDLQSELNGQQQKVNQEQGKVNKQQGLVNEEQQKVNAEQRRVSPVIEMAIQDILDSTVTKGLAHLVNTRAR